MPPSRDAAIAAILAEIERRRQTDSERLERLERIVSTSLLGHTVYLLSSLGVAIRAGKARAIVALFGGAGFLVYAIGIVAYALIYHSPPVALPTFGVSP
jgi:hypothetical protein